MIEQPLRCFFIISIDIKGLVCYYNIVKLRNTEA